MSASRGCKDGCGHGHRQTESYVRCRAWAVLTSRRQHHRRSLHHHPVSYHEARHCLLPVRPRSLTVSLLLPPPAPASADLSAATSHPGCHRGRPSKTEWQPTCSNGWWVARPQEASRQHQSCPCTGGRAAVRGRRHGCVRRHPQGLGCSTMSTQEQNWRERAAWPYRGAGGA